MEFGPVTFPAYAGATAGVRSLTDDYILRHLFAEPERLERLLALRGKPEDIAVPTEDFAPSTDQEPAAATPGPERRDNREKQFTDREEFLSWLTSQP
jgi:hypothetical protein